MSLRSWLAWFWTCVILFLCWLPRMYLVDEQRTSKPFFVPNFDKLVHLGIFAIFAVLWMRASSSGRRAFWVLASGVALALITELGQELPIVNRDSSLADGLADSVGVLVGLGVFFASRKLLERRVLPADA